MIIVYFLIGLVIGFAIYKIVNRYMEEKYILDKWDEFVNEMKESGKARWIEMSVYFNYLYYLDYVGYEQYKPYFMRIDIVNEYLEKDENIFPTNIKDRIKLFKSLCAEDMNSDVFSEELFDNFLEYLADEEYWGKDWFYTSNNPLWWSSEDAKEWVESLYNGRK